MRNGTKVLLGVIVGVALAAAAYFAFDYYVIDACLDGGGHWDWPTLTCEGGSGIQPPG